MNSQEAAKRLDHFIASDSLIRNEWTRYENGKQFACLLAAMVPECGEVENTSVCPAEVMPLWLAELTPFIDDRGTEENWVAVVTKFANLAHRWHILSNEDWECLDFQVRGICVSEAKSHTDNSQVIEICNVVIGLCEKAAAGEKVSEEEWFKARQETWAVSLTTAGSTRSARAATRAARLTAGAPAVASAGRAAAAAAVEAAAVAAVDAAAAEAAVDAAAAVAAVAGPKSWWSAVVGDRIIFATLDAIEKKIELRERR